jgi:hypothetical protein
LKQLAGSGFGGDGVDDSLAVAVGRTGGLADDSDDLQAVGAIRTRGRRSRPRN